MEENTIEDENKQNQEKKEEPEKESDIHLLSSEQENELLINYLILNILGIIIFFM